MGLELRKRVRIPSEYQRSHEKATNPLQTQLYEWREICFLWYFWAPRLTSLARRSNQGILWNSLLFISSFTLLHDFKQYLQLFCIILCYFSFFIGRTTFHIILLLTLLDYKHSNNSIVDITYISFHNPLLLRQLFLTPFRLLHLSNPNFNFFLHFSNSNAIYCQELLTSNYLSFIPTKSSST